MKSILTAIAFVTISISCSIGQDKSTAEPPDIFALLSVKLKDSLEGLAPAPSITVDNARIVVEYKTRKFIVYGQDKLGRYSATPYEETGPDYDGLLLAVSFQDGRYAGACEIPAELRRPYWTTFGNAYPVFKGEKHLHVNLSYGSRTNRKTLQTVKDLLASMVDDDPEASAGRAKSNGKVLEGGDSKPTDLQP